MSASAAAFEAELDAAARLAIALADAAGAVIRRYFRAPVSVEDKPDRSPVTVADRAAEAAMRELIAASVPAHGVIGEEYGNDRADAEFVWVLDPIDGTKSFLCGIPLFGTLIALLHRGRSVLGIIDQPILGERWVGIAGRPTRLNGAPITVRACAALDQATVFATAPDMFKGTDATCWARVTASARLVRYGTDCYAYGMLAAGFCDAVVEAQLKPYDYCAHVPIIAGAGGLVTDWNGAPASPAGDGRIVAAGDARVHGQLLALLA